MNTLMVTTNDEQKVKVCTKQLKHDSLKKSHKGSEVIKRVENK